MEKLKSKGFLNVKGKGIIFLIDSKKNHNITRVNVGDEVVIDNTQFLVHGIESERALIYPAPNKIGPVYGVLVKTTAQ